MICQSTTGIVLPIDIRTDIGYNISSIKSRIQSSYHSYASSTTSSTCPPPFKPQFIDRFESNINTYNTLLTPQIKSEQDDISYPSRNGAITKRKYDYAFFGRFSNNKSREEKPISLYDSYGNSIYDISSPSLSNGHHVIKYEYENKNDLKYKRNSNRSKNKLKKRQSKSKSRNKTKSRKKSKKRRNKNDNNNYNRNVNIIRNSNNSGNNTINNKYSVQSSIIGNDDEKLSQTIYNSNNKPTKYIEIKRGNINRKIKRKMYYNKKGENRANIYNNNIKPISPCEDVYCNDNTQMFQWIDRLEKLNKNLERMES